jgi:hypothetical protein
LICEPKEEFEIGEAPPAEATGQLPESFCDALVEWGAGSVESVERRCVGADVRGEGLRVGILNGGGEGAAAAVMGSNQVQDKIPFCMGEERIVREKNGDREQLVPEAVGKTGVGGERIPFREREGADAFGEKRLSEDRVERLAPEQ